MSLKFNSKACLEIRLFVQNSPLMALRSRRKVPIKDGVKRHRDVHCIVYLLCLGQNEPRDPSCCTARSTVQFPSDRSNRCRLVLALHLRCSYAVSFNPKRNCSAAKRILRALKQLATSSGHIPDSTTKDFHFHGSEDQTQVLPQVEQVLAG